jgi:hypothetical protein
MISTHNLNSSSRSSFRMVSDGKIKEYGQTFAMTICMMLRFFHAVMTGHASRFGLFKLRGVPAQFEAALALYRLLAQYKGDVPEDDLDWALHNTLETLLRPEGLGNRTIDCPTDQMLFLWAYLSGERYRIAAHLQSICAGLKCGFRCIDIHIARVDALQLQHELTSFYTDLPVQRMGREEVEDEDGEEDSGCLETEAASGVPVNADMASILKKLNGISADGEFH